MSNEHFSVQDAVLFGKEAWNRFVREHYPPVGAFMQTWEWGSFQEALGRKTERYFILKKKEPVAAFALAHHKMPLGYTYAYAPRGPVIAKKADPRMILSIFKTIRGWSANVHPSIAFLRLEPALSSLHPETRAHGFRIPPYYIQPRRNLTVPLDKPHAEILAGFHSSTRSNIKRALRRDVTEEAKTAVTEADLDEFFSMARDTIQRNSGKNAYPSPAYFRALLATIPLAGKTPNPDRLELSVRFGYQNGEPAAAQFTLLFGDTATYLYGASHTKTLPSKTTTYLHWAEMQEAKQKGFLFYDLGGIDDARWPTLTAFKRQFRGKEFEYTGNVDIPQKKSVYALYNFFKKRRQ